MTQRLALTLSQTRTLTLPTVAWQPRSNTGAVTLMTRLLTLPPTICTHRLWLGRYIGCYLNAGEDRVSGHVHDRTVAQCGALALEQGKPFFGMEFPQGSAADNHAQCLVLPALPTYVGGPP